MDGDRWSVRGSCSALRPPAWRWASGTPASQEALVCMFLEAASIALTLAMRSCRETHGVPVASRSDLEGGLQAQEGPPWGPCSPTGQRRRGGPSLYLSYFALHRGDNC